MVYDEYRILNVTASELSAYAYRKYGAGARRLFDSIVPVSSLPESIESTDELLMFAYSFSGTEYVISCEWPAEYMSGGRSRLVFVRGGNTVRTRNGFSDFRFLAETYISAYGYMVNRGTESVDVLMFYRDGDGPAAGFGLHIDIGSAEYVLKTLLERARIQHKRFIEISSEMPGEIRGLNFPHVSAREGQKDFIQKVYSSIRKGSDLLVSAPTGTGKTISVLFPAIKSVESSGIEKVFYFTHTNVSKEAVIKAFGSLTRNTKSVKCAVIDAKSSICPKKAAAGSGDDAACSVCGKAGKDRKAHPSGQSYEERENLAVDGALSLETNIYSFSSIKDTAEKYDVCPYELLLDISETCQLIVCDYNYLTDPRIRFRRYFEKEPGRYVFLIDEAHNLPERIRNTYTCGITTSFPEKCMKAYREAGESGEGAEEILGKFSSFMGRLGKACTENEMQVTENGTEITTGYYKSAAAPQALLKILSSLQLKLREDAFRSRDEGLLEVWKKVSDFLFAASASDERFVFYAGRYGDRVSAKVICLDPSEIIRGLSALSVSTVMFSASLTPFEYFMRLCGTESRDTLVLDSPFDPKKLKVLAYTGMNTRYANRADNARECAEIIYDTVSARKGKYIIYFPSYEYMGLVSKAFASRHRDCPFIIQKENMSPAEREKFLKVFRGDRYESVTGFCVLGGMYSESIDLVGESLIGTVIFGTGLPVPSNERNILEEYYDNLYDEGRNYAYICPGINKVIQAGGRVIRSESDHGVVVLVDERYRDPGLISLLSDTWKDIHSVRSRDSLSRSLREFWKTVEAK
ncbi:MAG: ATP-dependent DNA helicase [Clostridia bacterium]|nr:ATP-dependent DNA helicase [Clostridia bacterium]